MNYKDAFINNFLYLDNFWQRTKLNDLGGFLGSIDPDIWEDFSPADKSFLDLWFNITERLEHSNETIFTDLLPKYLNEVSSEMNYDFKTLLDKIQTDQQTEFNIWLHCITDTTRIVREHQKEISEW
jgi:hypothetical protein